MPFEKSPGRSLQEQLVDEVGRRIAHGVASAGHVLSPDALEREFGVSRSIVREALRVLETLGMITARPRIGTIVRGAEHWHLLDGRVIGWRSDGPDALEQLRELTQLRLAIEPAMTELAAASRSEEEILALEHHFSQMREALARMDAVAFASADSALHEVIMRASRSAVLQQLHGTLEAALRSRYSTGLPTFSDASGLALQRHGDLVRAVRDRDGVDAAAIMRLLIRESQVELFD